MRMGDVKSTLVLTMLAFLKVVVSYGANLTPFIFEEELIQYQYNFMQLLNSLYIVS